MSHIEKLGDAIIPVTAKYGISTRYPKKESDISSVFSILLFPKERKNLIPDAIPSKLHITIQKMQCGVCKKSRAPEYTGMVISIRC
jgi:hypothetical protein